MRIGPTEIIIILVIVMLVFGIGKLPELGKSLGEGLRSFKKVQEDITQEVKTTTATVTADNSPKTEVQDSTREADSEQIKDSSIKKDDEE